MADYSSLSGSTGGSSITGQLDVQWIVEQTIYAKKQPIRDLEPYQDLYKARKSAYQELNTYMTGIESSLFSIKTAGFESKSVNVGNEDILSASSGSTADTGSYSIIVRQLAQAQSASSQAASAVADPDDLIFSSGTFEITQGDETFTIDLDTEGSQSLNSIKEKINDSSLNVSATVINYGSDDGANADYRLQITSDSVGEANGFTISDTGVGTNMTTKIDAQDALVNINTADASDAIARSSNIITDIIPGVTLNLKSADPSSPVSLNVEADTESLKTKITEFADNFNKAIDFLNNQFYYDTEKGAAGVLSGQSTARKAQSDLLGMVTQRIEGISDSENIKSFANIGLSITTDGKLEIDEKVLGDVLESDLEGVQRLFKNTGTSDNVNVSFTKAESGTEPGEYDVNITRIAEQAKVVSDMEFDPADTYTDTLNIEFGSDSFSVDLTGTLDEMILTLNTYFTDNGITLNAGKTTGASGSVLQIYSDDYGSDYTVKVSSDNSLFTSEKTGTGIDVEGTIGGSTSEGKGRMLTSTEGDSSGLMVYVTASTTGDKGSVLYTRGPGEGLRERAYDFTFPYDGLIAKSIDALDSQLENIDKKIEDINRSLVSTEEILIKQFSQANEALAQMEYLVSTLEQSRSSKS